MQAEYKAESASLRNQDLTIRKLEEKVRSLEAAVEEKGIEVEWVRVEGCSASASINPGPSSWFLPWPGGWTMYVLHYSATSTFT